MPPSPNIVFPSSVQPLLPFSLLYLPLSLLLPLFLSSNFSFNWNHSSLIILIPCNFTLTVSLTLSFNVFFTILISAPHISCFWSLIKLTHFFVIIKHFLSFSPNSFSLSLSPSASSFSSFSLFLSVWNLPTYPFLLRPVTRNMPKPEQKQSSHKYRTPFISAVLSFIDRKESACRSVNAEQW